MTGHQRSTPPMSGDERAMLEGWLEFQRSTLLLKCQGLTDEQHRLASVPPSGLTLQGLFQHLAEVERNWFRRVLASEDAPPIYASASAADAGGHDGGFDLHPDISIGRAVQIWQSEVEAARANCARHHLDDASPFMGATVSLRWIYVHMVGEYARHNGHADLIRECIDGSTGV